MKISFTMLELGMCVIGGTVMAIIVHLFDYQHGIFSKRNRNIGGKTK